MDEPCLPRILALTANSADVAVVVAVFMIWTYHREVVSQQYPAVLGVGVHAQCSKQLQVLRCIRFIKSKSNSPPLGLQFR